MKTLSTFGTFVKVEFHQYLERIVGCNGVIYYRLFSFPPRHQFNQVSSVCFGIIHKTLVRQSHNWEVGCIIQTGCSAVRQRACFGSRMSGVRISPPRPYNELSNLLRHYNHSIISIKSILEFYSVTNSFQNQCPFGIPDRCPFSVLLTDVQS